MTDSGATRKSMRGLVLFGVSLVVVVLLIVGGSVAGDVLFIAAIAVLPVGAVYGLVSRTLLWRLRRRAAADALGAVQPSVAYPGAHFEQPIQHSDRIFTIILLVLAGLEALALVADAIVLAIEGPNYVHNNSSVLGNTELAFGGFALLFAVLLLCAIPFAAVIVTKQLRRPELALGEAHALATRTAAFRRIRSTRILARVAYIPLFAAAAFILAMAPSAFGY